MTPIEYIEANGGTINWMSEPATAPDGRKVKAWYEGSTKTIHTVPEDQYSSSQAFIKTMWHEAGHLVLTGETEAQCEQFAWCKMTENGYSTSGISFAAPVGKKYCRQFR